MGTSAILGGRGERVRVVASTSTWMEGEALRQLDAVSKLPGMLECVGMPDLHPGKAGPVGAAFLSRGIIRPNLVGSDIGCGMGLWATDLRVHKVKPDAVAGRLQGLDEPWGGDIGARLSDAGLPESDGDVSLGTIGRGNHFAELQAVDQLVRSGAAAGIESDRALLLVHTGSRSIGDSIFRRLVAGGIAEGVEEGTVGAAEYLAAHDHAIAWAEENRKVVAERFLEAVRADGARILDSCHNSVVRMGDGWLHRKGVSPADRGLLVVAGSRGHLSALVEPLPGAVDALWSVAHGAGRKIGRSEAKGKLSHCLRKVDLERNPFGGRVVCGDDRLIWEEAPQVYKPIASVIADLEASGMARLVAWLRPIVTFKTSSEGRAGRAAAGRDKDTRRGRGRGEKRWFA